MSSPTGKSKMEENCCVPCKRLFGSKRALQEHIKNARIHQSESRRQTQPVQSQQATYTRSQSLIIVGQPKNPFAQRVYSPLFPGVYSPLAPSIYSPLNQSAYLSSAAQISESDIQGNLMTMGIWPTFHTQTVIGEPIQAENSGIPISRLAIHSPSSESLTTDVGATFEHGNNYWSSIPESQHTSVLQKLSMHCISLDDLEKNNYILSPYDADAISSLRKCKNCHCFKKSRNKMKCSFHPGKRQPQSVSGGRRLYSCCGKSDAGCTSFPMHNYANADSKLVARYKAFATTPSHYSQLLKRRAVALDCEMAGGRGGSSELVLVSMVDFLSGESLVNALVQPTEKVVDWRTRWSGVTQKAMATAIAKGEALNGWKAARSALWAHIDSDTILVGQSLQHDLGVLRMIHTRVVDAGILARNAVDPTLGRVWGLKILCHELMDIKIQTGKKGHDCMEDTLAAREVVLWCIERPQELATWGLVKKEEEQRKKMKLQENALKEKLALEQAKKMQKNTAGAGYDYSSNGNTDAYGDDNEVLRWSDITEDCGWPHPDTRYDP